MLKKSLGKAAVGTAAASVIFAPGLFLGPQMANVACTYDGGVPTSTDLTLDKTQVEYGEVVNATANVTSGDGTPQGQVAFRIDGDKKSKQTLNNGSTTYTLPRVLDAGETYNIFAQFRGKCRFDDSNDNAFLTVFKSGTNTNPAVQNARKAKFVATVQGTGGLDPNGGKVIFQVKKPNGKTIRQGSDGLNSNARAKVNLKNLKKGNYTLVAKFTGTKNFESSTETRDFSV